MTQNRENKTRSRRKEKKPKKKKVRISSLKRENNRITVVLALICILFIGTIVYLSYFQIFKSEELKYHAANRRINYEQEKTLRGSIYDRNGELLAHSEFTGEDSQKRIYDKPYNYSHVIGYSHTAYGNAGLEESMNSELLGISAKQTNILERIGELKDKVINPNEKSYGHDLTITIDDSLQSEAYDKLEGYKGSIIIMDTETGEIYTMASNPGINVSNLDEEWEEIIQREDSPLINRATSGLYAPGSIFKIITATGILEDLDPEETYTSTGSITEDGYTLRDFDEIAYGPVALKDAFRQSVNTYFAYMGLELGETKLVELEKRYMLGEQIPFDINVEKSRIQTSNMSTADIMATSIGQGKTLVTPLNMVMMSAAIANEGNMLRPVLVKEIMDHEGEVLSTGSTKVISNVASPEIAEEINEMMVTVVNSRGGTGSGAAISNVTMAGKTGTAEVEGKESHAWFTGFAPAEDPKLAIVVMLENVGHTGGKVAAPIARDMMIDALNTIGYE